jgi:arylsulfatase A-like enzyme
MSNPKAAFAGRRRRQWPGSWRNVSDGNKRQGEFPNERPAHLVQVSGFWIANGQIAEFANDWDGYTGVIPKSSATVAEVLKDYGYHTAAWGKRDNTPAEQTTAAGPLMTGRPARLQIFLRLPWWRSVAIRTMPRPQHELCRTPPASGGHNYYHLSGDLADDAISWLRQHKAYSPDRPFLMYRASGASNGTHQVPKEWSDKYKGKFDDGWDKYRSHFGGTRNPKAVRRPAKIKPDATPRATQYFEIMGSRSIYHDGWIASAFRPRIPWVPVFHPELRWIFEPKLT